SLQNSLYEMGKKVLEKHSEIDEIKFSMPNKHHFEVDFTPFGLENNNEVFFAADRPYGIIEGSVVREGVATAPAAWEGIAGFC
ncbi:MAG: urate oxidase, partial [Lacisediminihabitans sp.]